MYLGTYEDIRRALDTLFEPGDAYTDDNEIVLSSDEEGKTVGRIFVEDDGLWTIYEVKDFQETGFVQQVTVPSARMSR